MDVFEIGPDVQRVRELVKPLAEGALFEFETVHGDTNSWQFHLKDLGEVRSRGRAQGQSGRAVAITRHLSEAPTQ